MENKYQAYFFQNGRVVFVEWKDIEEAVIQEKELLVVCNAWSGGYAVAIGADKRNGHEAWGEPEYVYEMYTYDVREQTFNAKEMQKFYKIIFTDGEMVYMETGEQATYYVDGMFADLDTTFEDYQRIRGYNGKTIEEFDKMYSKVDVEKTLKFLNDKEKAKCLSGYAMFWNDEN